MKTNLNYEQYIPTRILFGAGQLNNLHVQPMPGKRALIVISNGKSTRDNGYLGQHPELHRRILKEVSVRGWIQWRNIGWFYLRIPLCGWKEREDCCIMQLFYEWLHRQGADGSVIQNLHNMVFYLNGSASGGEWLHKQLIYSSTTETVADWMRVVQFARNARQSLYLSEISLVGNLFAILSVVVSVAF